MKTTVLLLSAILLVGSAVAYSEGNSKMAPDFDAITSSGKTISLQQFRGQVVLLDFWASWCKPCQEEFPFLIDLYRKNSDKKFVVLAVNLDEDATRIEQFLKRFNLRPGFPIITDPKGKIPAIYNIDRMPTTILIDPQGEIRYTRGGFQNSEKEKLSTALQALLAKEPEAPR